MATPRLRPASKHRSYLYRRQTDGSVRGSTSSESGLSPSCPRCRGTGRRGGLRRATCWDDGRRGRSVNQGSLRAGPPGACSAQAPFTDGPRGNSPCEARGPQCRTGRTPWDRRAASSVTLPAHASTPPATAGRADTRYLQSEQIFPRPLLLSFMILLQISRDFFLKVSSCKLPTSYSLSEIILPPGRVSGGPRTWLHTGSVCVHTCSQASTTRGIV